MDEQGEGGIYRKVVNAKDNVLLSVAYAGNQLLRAVARLVQEEYKFGDITKTLLRKTLDYLEKEA